MLDNQSLSRFKDDPVAKIIREWKESDSDNLVHEFGHLYSKLASALEKRENFDRKDRIRIRVLPVLIINAAAEKARIDIKLGNLDNQQP